ncbi:hypothetical protein VTN77DRAFT_1346 [Rasamsonia byssochlamydoides]|uniref:uncharacterized protein n=1 Tax=Rasamsonia byssochlamydoides TaxID=89139 RepID=UPI003742FF55
MELPSILILLLQLLLTTHIAKAELTINLNDGDSFKKAASTAAYDMVSYYNGNQSGQIPGKLEGTWWEGGAMFMTLIQYWHWTGDDSYNDITNQGMLWQAGENYDYMPKNWSIYLGNDDQMFWGLAAMTAAELNYPDVDGKPSWLSLAQAVFNTQVPRWDNATCNGGLRWQIFPSEPGYTMKNAISNGGIFQLAARLARYTNNQTYANWANTIWDWSATTPLLNTATWDIADSTSVESQCKDHDDDQWTYNYGTYLMGAAYMYNMTNADPKWKSAIDGLLGTIWRNFFPQQYGGNVMVEPCEVPKNCNRNEICFKGFLSSWLAFTSLLAPYTAGQIIPKLQQSALAAAKQCSGGSDGDHCGIAWCDPTWDGTQGLEQQMSTLSLFANNLVAFQSQGGGADGGADKNPAPVTSTTGGNSTSDPNAGTGSSSLADATGSILRPISTADRAGAGVLTVVFAMGWIGMVMWMIKDQW